MFKLKSEIQFDMAHYLSGYTGKCSNIHGHRYRLIAKLKSETLHPDGQLRGMVDDFSNFKNALKEIEEVFDHKLVLEDNEEGKALGGPGGKEAGVAGGRGEGECGGVFLIG